MRQPTAKGSDARRTKDKLSGPDFREFTRKVLGKGGTQVRGAAQKSNVKEQCRRATEKGSV